MIDRVPQGAEDPPKVRIGTWNTEWAVPGSARGEQVRRQLAEPPCDVLCVTEAVAGILPNGGHVVEGGSDWGYSIKEDRRKVLLWSKRPWSKVDSVGSKELPSGRFAAGVTETPVGHLTVSRFPTNRSRCAEAERNSYKFVGTKMSRDRVARARPARRPGRTRSSSLLCRWTL